MKKILFVCHGNICRSVMAEYIMKNLDKYNKFYVESCATTTEEIGNDIYPPVKEVLKSKNIIFDKHKARQINENDYLLTLSTCYNKTDRMVIHAKLIKKETK